MVEEFLLDEENFSEDYANFCMDLSREFVTGASKVYMPAFNDGLEKGSIVTEGELKIMSAQFHEGKYTLWVFSSPQRVYEWAKKECFYYAVSSKDVIKMIEHNNFEKVIIDNMFPVVQYEDYSLFRIKKGSRIIIGASSKPLPKNIREFYSRGFRRIKAVQAVYQYQMLVEKDKEKINELVLGIYCDELYDEVREEINNLVKSKIGKKRSLIVEFFKKDDKEKIDFLSKFGSEVLVYKRPSFWEKVFSS